MPWKKVIKGITKNPETNESDLDPNQLLTEKLRPFTLRAKLICVYIY